MHYDKLSGVANWTSAALETSGVVYAFGRLWKLKANCQVPVATRDVALERVKQPWLQ